jgi:hypothetical protein
MPLPCLWPPLVPWRVEHPIAVAAVTGLSSLMKQNKYPQEKGSGLAPSPMATDALKKSEAEMAPSPDEVARRAYFTYVNQDSRPGHEVEHWLKAEVELIAERKLTREHGFHNRT